MARSVISGTVVKIVCILYIFGAFSISALDLQNCQKFPCDPPKCPKAINCINGFVLDICGCCEVCAKGLNESCGQGLYDKCSDNLQCERSDSTEINPTQSGICREMTQNPTNKCDIYTCSADGASLECPLDSRPTVKPEPLSLPCCDTGSIAVCECAVSLCPPDLPCPVGFSTEIVQETLSTPGLCCNISKCSLTAKCADIVCPEEHVDDIPCPSDSYQPDSIVSQDGCCEIKQRCKCHPCPPVTCKSGLKVHVLNNGHGQPGSCCDDYKCVNESELTCFSDGKEYKNNATWRLDKCRTCMCKDGAKLCHTETCPTANCGWMVEQEGTCCAVCRGCVSEETHVLYNNSAKWQPDKCTHCECKDGQPYCISEMCDYKCTKPRKVPGECCPVCDFPDTTSRNFLEVPDSPQSEQPEHCVTEDKCTRVCPGGRRIDSLGCPLCACKAEKCDLVCRQGLKIDDAGNEICQCKKPRYVCPPLSNCKKDCIYGFRKTRYGCNKCRCNKCPSFNCKKKCPHGFEMNAHNCQICKCRDNTQPTNIIPVTKDQSCLTPEGNYYEDGESWHDGCRRCFCHNGKEMCYLIRCMPLACPNPIFVVGDCCPSCPGMKSTDVRKPLTEQCQTTDGRHYTEGETWRLDSCTECICHEGLILCETQTCPPLLCHYPIKHRSQCCPVCKTAEANELIEARKPRSCYTNGQLRHKHGTLWRVNPCQSCVCRYGVIHCYSQSCAPTTCHYMTLRKGQCCPTCMDVLKSAACRNRGEVYAVGEEWQSECSLCTCKEGGSTVCLNMTCPHLNCFVQVRKPGACCPVCLANSGYTLQTKQYPESNRRDDNVHYIQPYHSHDHLTITILAVLFSLTFIALIIGVLIILRRRNSCMFKTTSDNRLPGYTSRQATPNDDFHGSAPFLQKMKPFGNYSKASTPENNQFSELLSSDKKWHDSTTDTSVSSTA